MSNILSLGNKKGNFLPRDSEKVLLGAIQKTKLRAEWRIINAIWPDAYEVSLNLATYLLDIPKAKNGNPLIDECMLTALRTVQVLNKNRPEDDVSGHFIRGYVTALLRGTPELTRQVIGIETADRRYLWDPNHESMHQFCLRMGKEPEILATRDKSMDGRLVKNMLLSRIADRHTIEFIDKHLDQELLQ